MLDQGTHTRCANRNSAGNRRYRLEIDSAGGRRVAGDQNNRLGRLAIRRGPDGVKTSRGDGDVTMEHAGLGVGPQANRVELPGGIRDARLDWRKLHGGLLSLAPVDPLRAAQADPHTSK